LYADNEYDVVVLDQYMPELDGEDVAAEIRKFLTDVPLIAITSDDTLRNHLIDKGFNEVIVKPLRGYEAIDLIKTYF
jgi:CheY-like chemotaxis protein